MDFILVGPSLLSEASYFCKQNSGQNILKVCEEFQSCLLLLYSSDLESSELANIDCSGGEIAS